MMTVNRDVILRDGYEKATRIAIEPYLSDAEIVKMYSEKMLAYGRDCGYTFTEEEVKDYIQHQLIDVDMLNAKNNTPVELRFQ